MDFYLFSQSICIECFSGSHVLFCFVFLKRSFNLESIGTTYLKFILSMQVMYLKIDFYWWTELLLISKFKNTTAGTPVLIWELSWLQRSVVSSSVFHTLQTTKFGPAGSGYRNCCIYWIHLRSERFLKFLFFLSLSPRIAACLSWRLRMLPACPQICRNFWSGVLVCHWAEQSVKNKFVCERCFLKSFKALQKTLQFSKTFWTNTTSK